MGAPFSNQTCALRGNGANSAQIVSGPRWPEQIVGIGSELELEVSLLNEEILEASNPGWTVPAMYNQAKRLVPPSNNIPSRELAVS